MSERKSVTREDIRDAIASLGSFDGRYTGPDHRATLIFDALPATPPASETVAAARAAVLDRFQPLLAGEHYGAVRNLMTFEAAIRAEADERVADLEQRLADCITAGTGPAFDAVRAEQTSPASETVDAATVRALHDGIEERLTNIGDPFAKRESIHAYIDAWWFTAEAAIRAEADERVRALREAAQGVFDEIVEEWQGSAFTLSPALWRLRAALSDAAPEDASA